MQVQSKRMQVLAKQATCRVYGHCSIISVEAMDGIRQKHTEKPTFLVARYPVNICNSISNFKHEHKTNMSLGIRCMGIVTNLNLLGFLEINRANFISFDNKALFSFCFLAILMFCFARVSSFVVYSVLSFLS